MIVVRNVFQLKFGKAREAVALMKQGIAIQKQALAGVDFSTRLLTDVTGPNYTLVLELTVPNLATFECTLLTGWRASKQIVLGRPDAQQDDPQNEGETRSESAEVFRPAVRSTRRAEPTPITGCYACESQGG
jgi:hypothetical protein